MHLSRVVLNPVRRGARRLLGSPQVMHAAVLASFPDPAGGAGGRVLWRVDGETPHRRSLYVVSPSQPDFTHLVEQAGWPTTQTWDTTPYELFLEQLAPEQTWHFRLTANPVRKTRVRASDLDTRLVGHVTVKHQERWLLDRAEQLGVTFPDGPHGQGGAAVTRRGTLRFRRENQWVTLTVATYEGHLSVVDADRLRSALVRGVGRAKAYGCGLLTLARPLGVSP